MRSWRSRKKVRRHMSADHLRVPPTTRRVRFLLAALVLLAVGVIAPSAAVADPPYAAVAPFNGNTISTTLGLPAPYPWCAFDTQGSMTAGGSQEGSPLSLIPYAAIGCTLESFKTEASTAGLPERMSYRKI